MYLSGEILQEVERQYGRPAEACAAAEFSAGAFALLERCAVKGRAHDVTLFIRHPDDSGIAPASRFALIRKPSYPAGVFRPPSGGVEPDEPFAVGAVREALEETGLEIRLERYLLRVRAEFACEGRITVWQTHLFSAVALHTRIDPQDRKEIAEAQWVTIEAMQNRMRPAMLAIGSAGMRYRTELQDAGLRLLGWEAKGDEADITGSAARGAWCEVDGVPGLGDSRLLRFGGAGVPGPAGGRRAH